MMPLGISFSPGPFDVICARGKEAKNHPGNIRFRGMVEKAVSRYANASNRYEKSIVVSTIIETVRKESCGGGFVKRNEHDGRWYEVGDTLAREKVGQWLREKLHVNYKSSTKAKRKKMKEINEKASNEVEQAALRDESIAQKIEGLSATFEQVEKSSPSEDLLEIAMTRANIDLLASLKSGNYILSAGENGCSMDESSE